MSPQDRAKLSLALRIRRNPDDHRIMQAVESCADEQCRICEYIYRRFEW